MKILPLMVLLAVGCTTWGQARSQPSSGDDLVRLTMKLDRSVYRRGTPVNVSLVIRAGKRGATLPNSFAAFNETCQSGFSAVLLTASGDSAIKNLPGCAGETAGSSADTAKEQLRHFVYLAPGDTRSWRTTLVSTVDKPGVYTVVGEYLSAAYMMADVAKLPEVHGTMVTGTISAKRQSIRIR